MSDLSTNNNSTSNQITSVNQEGQVDSSEAKIPPDCPQTEDQKSPPPAAAEQPIGDNNTMTAEEDRKLPSPANINNNNITTSTTTSNRRLCRYPGCTRVIKSQGHCQRHGAKTKRCRVEGCEKQAQGTHDGMCKRHWKALHFPELEENNDSNKTGGGQVPPKPQGESVYESVLPQSIAFRPPNQTTTTSTTTPNIHVNLPEGLPVMPLVRFLRRGGSKPKGWHRNEERLARGLNPANPSTLQLEPWERQLALVEVLLLSGGTPFANFKDLAHAWGRDKGFHQNLAISVCERRGEVERKRRKDSGRKVSPEEMQLAKRIKTSSDDIGKSVGV